MNEYFDNPIMRVNVKTNLLVRILSEYSIDSFFKTQFLNEFKDLIIEDHGDKCYDCIQDNHGFFYYLTAKPLSFSFIE